MTINGLKRDLKALIDDEKRYEKEHKDDPNSKVRGMASRRDSSLPKYLR